MIDLQVGPAAGRDEPLITLLLGTDRDWFGMALEAVLQPEGFEIFRARSSEEVARFVQVETPDIVLLDEVLPGPGIPELCRALCAGPLPESVPLVVYTASGLTYEQAHTEALEAGAWMVLPEPIRAARMVATLKRLLALGRALAGQGLAASGRGGARGVLTQTELEQLLPFMNALATRQRAPLSFAAVGFTRKGDVAIGEPHQRAAAELFAGHLRKADVCATLDEGDLAILAFGTTAEGASVLLRRLSNVATGEAEADEDSLLSAGIVQLDGSGTGEEPDGRRASNGEWRQRVEAARAALDDARRTGGGIRIARGA